MAKVEIYSPTVGMLAMWNAEDGALVEKGQMIGAVECMKTFFDFRAVESGIIRFQKKIGEAVAQNELLAIIETPE